MSHLRDPITGLCQVCGKSGLHDHSGMTSHGHGDADSPHPGRGSSSSRHKVIYVESPTPSKASGRSSTRELLFTPSPVPPHSKVRGRSPSPTSSVHIVEKTTRRASPTTKKTVIVEERVPSPEDSVTVVRRQFVGGNRRHHLGGNSSRKSRFDCFRRCCRCRCCRKNRGHHRGYREDRCCGYRNHETASYGAGTWGPRRCCCVLLTIGILLGLAGLIAGLYFGITAAQAEQARQQQVSSYIQNNEVNYVVYGADQPCNQYNNGTAGAAIPNCDATTTAIGAPPAGFQAPNAATNAAATTVLRARLLSSWHVHLVAALLLSQLITLNVGLRSIS